jgi:hypothetical protein
MALAVQGFTKLAFIRYIVSFISCADFVLKSKKKENVEIADQIAFRPFQ